jgi:predicted glycosyltransferase
LLKISPEKVHDLEANAKFMVTEGATMASESFVHGVPYLYLNPLKCGYIDYQCKNYPDKCFHTTDTDEALRIINQLVKLNVDSETIRTDIERLTINPTDLLVWFVENYPESKCIIRENLECQYNFR